MMELYLFEPQRDHHKAFCGPSHSVTAVLLKQVPYNKQARQEHL